MLIEILMPLSVHYLYISLIKNEFYTFNLAYFLKIVYRHKISK